MKWFLYIEFIALLTSHGAKSQEQLVLQNNLVWLSNENLVINPGFEDYHLVSWSWPWPDSVYTPTGFNSTIDFFHLEHNNPNRRPPSLSAGYQELILSGDNRGFLGFLPIWYYKDDQSPYAAEYVGMTLAKPIDAGVYLIEFDYVSSERRNIWPHYIGCAFDFDPTEYLDSFLFDFNFGEAPIVFDTVNWNKFQLLLNAQGGEKQLIIGEFNVDGLDFSIYSDQYVGVVNNRELLASYFFIDNVSVRKVEKLLPIEEQLFTLFPNPSPNGQFTLAYNLPGEEPVAFVLYDAIGKRVAEEILPAGVQHVSLNFPSLASGIYSWRVEDRNNGNAVMGRGKVVVGR
jgi:hypothetical protein